MGQKLLPIGIAAAIYLLAVAGLFGQANQRSYDVPGEVPGAPPAPIAPAPNTPAPTTPALAAPTLVTPAPVPVSSAMPGPCGGACNPPVVPCGACSQQTVLVPEYTTETRKVRCVEYAAETRQCVVTRCQRVPETRTVQVPDTEWVPRSRTTTETYTVSVPVAVSVPEQYQVNVTTYRDVPRSYTVSVPVWRDKTETCTVMVPHVETRQTNRPVVRCVPVAETRTVCDAAGNWKQVSATVMKEQVVEEPCSYEVTVNRPETRTQVVRVREFETRTQTRMERVAEVHPETRNWTYSAVAWQPEQRSRQVEIAFRVPRPTMRTEQVTMYREVPVQETQQYVAMVPREVEREVQVPTYRLVARTINVPAGSPCIVAETPSGTTVR